MLKAEKLQDSNGQRHKYNPNSIIAEYNDVISHKPIIYTEWNKVNISNIENKKLYLLMRGNLFFDLMTAKRRHNRFNNMM